MDEEKFENLWKMTDEEIENLIIELSEQEKDELIRYLIMFNKKSWELYLSVFKTNEQIINLQKLGREKGEAIIDELFERLDKEKMELLNKEAIMKIFNCQDDKALKILKMMYANNFGCKIGKEYCITRNEFTKFINSYKGKDLKI